MPADGERRFRRFQMYRYRVIYLRVWRNKEEVKETKSFEATNAWDARERARKIVVDLDRSARKMSDGLERCELVGLRRITRRAVSEKSVPVPLSRGLS